MLINQLIRGLLRPIVNLEVCLCFCCFRGVVKFKQERAFPIRAQYYKQAIVSEDILVPVVTLKLPLEVMKTMQTAHSS